MHVDVTFDPLKDALNRIQHGVSLDLVREIAWDEIVSWGGRAPGLWRELVRSVLRRFTAVCSAWYSHGETARFASSVCVAPTIGKKIDTNAKISRYVLNTLEEEAEIQRGIEMDPDPDPDTIDFSDESTPLTPFSFHGLRVKDASPSHADC